MKGNGQQERKLDVVRVSLSGPMDQYMKDGGRTALPVAKVVCCTLKEMSILESGKMIWPMERDLTSEQTAQLTKANGSTMSNMGKAWRLGKIMRDLKAIM